MHRQNIITPEESSLKQSRLGALPKPSPRRKATGHTDQNQNDVGQLICQGSPALPPMNELCSPLASAKKVYGIKMLFPLTLK